MKKRPIPLRRRSFPILGLLLAIASAANAAETIHEYMFLIDTSASMRENKLVGPLRVALGDFADTIPKDGKSRVWILPFDRGLNKEYLVKQIRRTDDLQAAKVFLNEAEYQGDATFIYQSLDTVLSSIEQTLRDGDGHDFTVHLFTDGQDNGPTTYSFEKNAERFVQLRKNAGGAIQLYYHSLKTAVPDNVAKAIQATEGMYSINDVGIPPRARFVLPPNASVLENSAITFVNESIGQIDAYEWDMGDGSASREKSPTHAFKKPGAYTVTLTASNPAGKSKATLAIEVRGAPPQARFALSEPDKPKYVGEPVGFRDRSLGQITTRAWTFGDSQGTSAEANPEFVFKEPGRVKVTLRIEGPFGKDETSAFVTLEQRPTIAFSFFPKAPLQKKEVMFVNESKGDFRAWRWQFGDGATSQEMSPRHVFDKPGTYKVQLEGQNRSGAWLSGGVQEVVVSSGYVKPDAKFTLPVQSIGIGESLTLVDQSAGTIDAWQWDMGDGTVIKTPAAKHAYRKDGRFKVALKVSGPAGSSTAVNELTVQPAVLDFSFGPAALVDGRPVTFVNESVGAYRDWRWDFGDGTKGAAKTAEHAYAKPGKYTVRLRAVGPLGQPEEKTKDVTVASSAVPPKARFQLQLGTIESDKTIKLSHGSSGTIGKVEWDMGDGTRLAGDKVEHRYAAPGEYKITLTVSNETSSDSTSQTLKVIDVYQEPEIDFGPQTPVRGIAPLTVTLENRCRGSIKSYRWEFGDGKTTDDRDPPPHEYATPGKYTICLTVVDRKDQSFTSTTSENVVVDVLPPPRYPAWVAWAAAVGGYLIAWLNIWRQWWPWNLRQILYDEDGNPGSYASWTRDWAHDSGMFRVVMRRTPWLGKRYRLQLEGRTVAATDTITGDPLANDDRIQASAGIQIGGSSTVTIQQLNDGSASCIAAQAAALAFGIAVLILLLWLRCPA